MQSSRSLRGGDIVPSCRLNAPPEKERHLVLCLRAGAVFMLHMGCDVHAACDMCVPLLPEAVQFWRHATHDISQANRHKSIQTCAMSKT